MPNIPMMLDTPKNASKEERLDIAIKNTSALAIYGSPMTPSLARQLKARLQKLMWCVDNIDANIGLPVKVGSPVWYVNGESMIIADPEPAMVMQHIPRRWWRKEKFLIQFENGMLEEAIPAEIWVREGETQ